jgi:hypothetical protein
MQFNLDQYRSHRGGYGYLIRWLLYAVVLFGLMWLIRYKIKSHPHQKQSVEEGIEVGITK